MSLSTTVCKDFGWCCGTVPTSPQLREAAVVLDSRRLHAHDAALERAIVGREADIVSAGRVSLDVTLPVTLAAPLCLNALLSNSFDAFSY